MIQRLHKLRRLYCDFPLHQLLIVVFLFFALLIPFADWFGQIIFELVARLVFPSLLATGLLPLLHALAQLSHELHFFLHPLQLLQELLYRQLGTDIEQLPAYREGAFHKLLVTQRFDVGDDVEDGLVELGGVLDEDVVDDPEVELHGLALDLFLVDCGLAPADLSDDAHGLAAVLEPPQVVLQLAERQHIQNIKRLGMHHHSLEVRLQADWLQPAADVHHSHDEVPFAADFLHLVLLEALPAAAPRLRRVVARLEHHDLPEALEDGQVGRVVVLQEPDEGQSVPAEEVALSGELGEVIASDEGYFAEELLLLYQHKRIVLHLHNAPLLLVVEEEVVDYLRLLQRNDEVVPLPLEHLATAEAGIHYVVLLLELPPHEQHAGVVAVPAAADEGDQEAQPEEGAHCRPDYPLLVAVPEAERLVVGDLQLVARQVAVSCLADTHHRKESEYS